jgi:hypothetical protein
MVKIRIVLLSMFISSFGKQLESYYRTVDQKTGIVSWKASFPKIKTAEGIFLRQSGDPALAGPVTLRPHLTMG